jgi:hypothetical protein
MLTPDKLSRLAIAPKTPIASFVKRLRCGKCGSRSVLCDPETSAAANSGTDYEAVIAGREQCAGFF